MVSLASCRRILERLSALPESQRRTVRGLHPDRAPTIVAGVVMVIEALRVFGLDSTAVSDHDLLRGAALETVHRGPEERPAGAHDMTLVAARRAPHASKHRRSHASTRRVAWRVNPITTFVGQTGRMLDGRP